MGGEAQASLPFFGLFEALSTLRSAQHKNEMEEYNLEHTNNEDKTRTKEHQESSEPDIQNAALSLKMKNAYLKPTTTQALIAKILHVTTVIKAKFPELSKFLDEIPESDLDPKYSKISLKDLHEYYQSLNAILDKYKLEHPDK